MYSHRGITALAILFLASMLVAAGCSYKAGRLMGGMKDRQLQPLFSAVRTGDLQAMDSLLTRNPGLARAHDSSGYTALHWASVDGNKEVMALLIRKGADIDGLNRSGETPLHLACAAGRQEAVRLLLASGASVNVKRKEGETPMRIAGLRGYGEIQSLLARQGGHE